MESVRPSQDGPVSKQSVHHPNNGPVSWESVRLINDGPLSRESAGLPKVVQWRGSRYPLLTMVPCRKNRCALPRRSLIEEVGVPSQDGPVSKESVHPPHYGYVSKESVRTSSMVPC